MIHYGDITKISGYDVPIVDCVIGGSPCQDLSVAGNREGLDGEQSVLLVEQLRVIKEMRDRDAQSGRTGEFIRPRFMVWENVPGAFSTNGGKDFQKVLEETAKIIDKDAVIPMPPKDKWTTSGAIVGDGWSIAWRVLDAQFWGVPQRRRRIALVADFGGGCAQEVLFERKGLRRDSEESRTERKGTSKDAQGCTSVYDSTRESISFEPGIAQREGGHIYEDVSGTLRANAGDNQTITGAKTNCLRSKSADADHIPCVVMDRSAYNQGENAKFNIGIDENGVAFSCIAKGPGAVAYGFYPQMKAESIVWTEDKACALVNGTNPGFHNGVCCKSQYSQHYIVRRLTPLECERLQGFADGWTDIGEYTDSKGKKKQSSDSARYKALGNSIALPPWKWVLKRICSHYERDATLASLFDGIGGFPCIWEQINGKGSCLWASEIEDFPIAVTKTRIG